MKWISCFGKLSSISKISGPRAKGSEINFGRDTHMTGPIMTGTLKESPMTYHHIWSWVTLKGQSQGHSDFEALYLVKCAELGHKLLLNINTKEYIGRPMTLSHLILNDLERSNSRSLRFRSLMCCKGADLGHIDQIK